MILLLFLYELLTKARPPGYIPQPMRQTLPLWLGLALLFPLAQGCDKDKNATPSTAANQEVRLGYFANVTHAQAVLGVSGGSFEKAIAPAKLSTKVFNAGPSLIEALFAGEIDIGYVGPGPALNAHAKSRGEKVRIIAGSAANGVLIVARKDSGINSLADLAGKRIATPQLGNTQDISARHYLSTELRQKDLNNILPIANSEQAALMTRGEIDAAWAPEPWGSRLIVEGNARLLAEEKDLWPGKQFSLTLVVTTPEFLAKHPDLVEKMLTVHVRLTRWLNSAPQTWATPLDQALKQLTGKSLPPGLVASSMNYVRFTEEPLDQTLTTMNQWAYDLKLINSPTIAPGLVDTTILRKVQAHSTTQPQPADH
jgi:NitT/TauT family transport system substrate-binding protein